MFFNKEEKRFINHLKDLQKKSYYMQSEVFTDFLSVREAAILNQSIASLPDGRFLLYGGVQGAERQMACFYPSFFDKEELSFPISALEITVAGAKFHRSFPKHGDFLGAILGLGIERKLIGDIYVFPERCCAHLFCSEIIQAFIISELKVVRNCKVNVHLISPSQMEASARLESHTGSVSSLRFDSIVSEVFHLSRGKIKDFFHAEKLIVNGCLPSSLHQSVKEGDIISCRGYGKFIFYEVTGKTKKDRIKIHYGLYS